MKNEINIVYGKLVMEFVVSLIRQLKLRLNVELDANGKILVLVQKKKKKLKKSLIQIHPIMLNF